MKKPIDYTKGLIYKICCNDENIKDLYIGSTADFTQRKGTHKYNCYNEKSPGYNCKVYKFIRDNGGWSNWTMIELYKYPCINKRELEQEEDRMMVELKSTLNEKKAFVTEEENKKYHIEYRNDNRETMTKYHIEYRDIHRETINKKSAEYRAKNRETINMKHREKIECIKCGCMINRGGKSRHMKSDKCISHNKPPIDN